MYTTIIYPAYTMQYCVSDVLVYSHSYTSSQSLKIDEKRRPPPPNEKYHNNPKIETTNFIISHNGNTFVSQVLSHKMFA